MPVSSLKRPTIGVLPGWEVYENANLVNYLGPLLYGIRAAARKRGCNLLIACGMGFPGGQLGGIQPAWPEAAPDTYFIPVGPFNSDCLIVINPLVSEARIAYVRKLIEAGGRIVFVGTALGGPAVAIDNRGGIRLAVKHLVEHGHRRIAFIAGSPNDLHGDSEERLQAYRSTLQECGLEADPALIAYGLHIVEGGRMAMQEILDAKTPFTAVLGSSDECAIGAMQVLNENGYRIPEDVALIGFDDESEAVVQDPPLTSVHSPTFERGFRALELALDVAEGRRQDGVVVTVPARLMVRQSCGCMTLENDPAAPRAAASNPGLDQSGTPDGLGLSQSMAEAVLSCSHYLIPEQVEAVCRELVQSYQKALQRSELHEFYRALRKTLRDAQAAGDDVYAWLLAISTLRKNLPLLLNTAGHARREWAEGALAGASELIKEAMHRQHKRFLVDQKQTTDRMASLTSQLFATLDENQIFTVLAERLPEMGIPHAAIVLYESEAGEPVSHVRIRTIPGRWDSSFRFPARDFPPTGLYPLSEPYSLALVPLGIQGRLSGFAAFDSARLELYGAIVQQLELAFHSAQLYRQANEGRRMAEDGRRLAEAADQMKSRFLSTVSHELRTPLTVISALSSELLKELQDGAALPPFYRDYVEKIHNSTRHLDGLIRDVLDLAHNQVGQLKLACERLDTVEVLRSVAIAAAQLAHDKGLACRVEIPEDLPGIWGDRTRLQQVLLNLVNNAVKFTARGEICIRASATPKQITVVVSDTGLGIPKNELKTIFDEFRQSERTAKRGYGGLGLGLAICKSLVEMHGGEIHAESIGGEGIGSRFIVQLPVMDENAADETAAGRISPAETVLILSNHSESGETLRGMLIRHGIGAEVGEFHDTHDWFSQLPAFRFNAVILDKELQSDRGWEIFKALKENPGTRDIPIMFYSLSPDGDAGSLFSLDYLRKPVGTPELERALKQHGFIGYGHGKTILIADDEPSILEMHVRILQKTALAWRVLQARDGREALGLIRQEKPDLVLLDLFMPELDGFGVLEAMQREKSLCNVPVIVLTGQTLTSDEMRRLDRGVSAVLRKGVYNTEEMIGRMVGVLERSGRPGAEAQRLARKAMAYIHEHYSESITRDQIAAHLGVNEDHLTRCFHEETGLTPMTYLRRYRLDQAKNLLADGEKSVTEVALAVGFSDSNYFSRAFRQATGTSPSAYRRA